MTREVRAETRPSIFTNRSNAKIQLKDVYTYVTITQPELAKFGGSRDKTGKIWHLNSIIAAETGEYLRTPHFKI